jgi:glucokinase
VTALLGSSTAEEAAKKLGLSARTSRRYMANPAVRAAVSEAQAKIMAEVSAQAVGAMSEALETLKEIARNKKMPPAARVSAARAILGTGTGLHELTDLEARLAALEGEK